MSIASINQFFPARFDKGPVCVMQSIGKAATGEEVGVSWWIREATERERQDETMGKRGWVLEQRRPNGETKIMFTHHFPQALFFTAVLTSLTDAYCEVCHMTLAENREEYKDDEEQLMTSTRVLAPIMAGTANQLRVDANEILTEHLSQFPAGAKLIKEESERMINGVMQAAAGALGQIGVPPGTDKDKMPA